MGLFSSIGKAIGSAVSGVGKVVGGVVKTAVGVVKAPINLLTGKEDPFKDIKEGLGKTFGGLGDIFLKTPLHLASALGPTGGAVLGAVGGALLTPFCPPLGAILGGMLGNQLGQAGRNFENAEQGIYAPGGQNPTNRMFIYPPYPARPESPQIGGQQTLFGQPMMPMSPWQQQPSIWNQAPGSDININGNGNTIIIGGNGYMPRPFQRPLNSMAI